MVQVSLCRRSLMCDTAIVVDDDDDDENITGNKVKVPASYDSFDQLCANADERLFF